MRRLRDEKKAVFLQAQRYNCSVSVGCKYTRDCTLLGASSYVS